jgi:tetrapyrrole methylase family protein / MazG family protein
MTRGNKIIDQQITKEQEPGQDQKHAHLRATAETDVDAFVRLRDIVELLRVECPWDREQTHATLRSCIIEEVYEVAEAIDNQDMDNLKEELGDVLLQIIFHASLANETGNFNYTDLVNGECEKMIRRHPHVFSDVESNTVDKVLEKWENIKRGEYLEASHSERLEGVPKALPALIRSQKVQEKAARVGFDWKDVSGALNKLSEELVELQEAYESGDRMRTADELGDLLFSVVNVSRFMKVNPEAALEATIDKFIRRFRHIEATVKARGVSLDEMELSEMDKIWEEAKRLEQLTK